MRISSLLKDRPRTPLQEACDWIEHILRHGGSKRLRPQVFNIPWYQYYLLDVITFLVALVTVFVVTIRLTCRYLCRMYCNREGSKKKKKWSKSKRLQLRLMSIEPFSIYNYIMYINTGNPGSVKVPQYNFSKITVFVRGKIRSWNLWEIPNISQWNLPCS